MDSVAWLIPIVILISALAIARLAHLNKLSWKYIIPVIIIPNLPLAVWDYYFVDWGVWKVSGNNWVNVFLFYPVLFAFSLSVYYLIRQRITKQYLGATTLWGISILFFLVLIFIWFTHIKITYLSIPTLYSAFLVLVIFVFYKRTYTQNFFITYASLAIPYIIVKQIQISAGYLTYNKDMLTGVYIFNVPIEELIIIFAITLMTIISFEYLLKKKPVPTAQ